MTSAGGGYVLATKPERGRTWGEILGEIMHMHGFETGTEFTYDVVGMRFWLGGDDGLDWCAV